VTGVILRRKQLIIYDRVLITLSSIVHYIVCPMIILMAWSRQMLWQPIIMFCGRSLPVF